MPQVFSVLAGVLSTSWRLRVPFIQSHLVFNILLAAFFVPVMAATVQGALMLSGEPALADFDIALFLLSPIGFLAGFLLGGMALVLLVLDVAFMMAVALRDRHNMASGLWDGILLVLPRAPHVLALALHMSARLLLMALPFLAVCGLAYTRWISDFDINYYLTEKPPEFMRTVFVCGLSLAAMAALMIWRVLGWVLALPLVVFEKHNALAGLNNSRKRMKGRRLLILGKLASLSIVSFLVGSILVSALIFPMQFGLDIVPFGLRGAALFLVLASILWAAINLVVTAVLTGSFATLIMQEAKWPYVHETHQSHALRPVYVVGLAVTAALAAFGAVGVAELAAVDQSQPVAIIAHRGAAGARPENTMASVQKALTDGADWIEIDVQETADGAIVVIHDSDFMKVAGRNLKVWDATLDDLSDIDIGSWFSEEFASERTPLLSDVLRAAKDKAGVIIELKYYGHDLMLEQRVVDIVEAEEMVEHVKIMSLKSGALEKMRALRPSWTNGFLASASVGKMWELDVDFLAVNSATVSHNMIKNSQAVGKDVYVWTVNDALAMSAMVSLGVDGLITDEPAVARKVLSERRELTGVERLVIGLAGRIGLIVEGPDDANG